MHEITVETGEWKKLVDPIVRKCKLAASLNMEAKFNTVGAKALAELLVQMAAILDGEDDD